MVLTVVAVVATIVMRGTSGWQMQGCTITNKTVKQWTTAVDSPWKLNTTCGVIDTTEQQWVGLTAGQTYDMHVTQLPFDSYPTLADTVEP